MYNKNHGRFTSPDPLFIEAKRLNNPQLFNLYGYVRNNPLSFTDSTGLDIEVTGEAQEAYRKRLQQNLSFKVQINEKTNKIQIVDDKGNVLDKKAVKELGKGLKGGEKELFTAITDTKNHAVIDTVGESASVDFGRFDGKGKNTIDASDLSILDNSSDNGGFTSAQVVGHETLEAYHSAINQTTVATDSHNFANKFFSGISVVQDPKLVQVYYEPGTKNITHASGVFNIQGTNTNIRIERQFLTPIPENAIPKPPIPAHIVDVRREP